MSAQSKSARQQADELSKQSNAAWEKARCATSSMLCSDLCFCMQYHSVRQSVTCGVRMQVEALKAKARDPNTVRDLHKPLLL